jgi:signal transduction histidine kinase
LNLRKKTILLVFFVSLTILLGTIGTANFVVLTGFEKLEHDDVVTQVERAANSFYSQIKGLDSLVADYATWDDSYQFIQDNNTAFIENNIVDETFQHLNINLMMYINNSGMIIYSQMHGLDSSSSSLFEGLPDYFFEQRVWILNEDMPYAAGFYSFGGSVFLFSSRAILTSNGDGPILGAVVMARQVTSEFVSAMEDQTHLHIEIAEVKSANTAGFVEAKANLAGQGSFFVKAENETYINGYASVKDHNGFDSIILKASLERHIYNQGLSTITTFELLTLVWFTVFGLVIVINLERSVISRVLKLTRSVTAIRESGSLEERGVLGDAKFTRAKDELSSLSGSINGMLDSIQDVTAKLQKSQRLATVGELAVMIAHDLRNPLQGIKIASQGLNNEKIVDMEKKKKLIRLIDRDVSYCEKIVNDLLGYSGSLKVMLMETDLKTLLSSSLSHLQVPENIRLVDLTFSSPKLYIDIDKMTRVFDNLIKNAFDAMPQGGSLTIKNEFLNGVARISFADTGSGIDKEHLAKLFTPLFTTKAKGMGFGLAICQRIVEAHNGKISVESAINVGTTFTIEVPLIERPPH